MNSHDDDHDALRYYAEWEKEQQRPYDWQDKLVIGASWVCFVVCLGILIWGK